MVRREYPSRLSRCRLVAVIAFAALASGCQQRMADQPSFKPLQPSTFFDDDRSARKLVPGTVARGHLGVNRAFFTGRMQEGQAPSAPAQGAENTKQAFEENAAFVREFPIPVTEKLIQHGYNRYMIYCVVCHDPLGTGQGKIVERGYTTPPSYHIDRLRNAPVGRLFAVATEGYGSMPSYAAQIPPEDRWAIVAYIKALQLSQHFPVESLTPEMQAALSAAAPTAPASAGREGSP